MHNRHWWFACLALSACTQIVDFDRSKIPGHGGPDGGDPGMDGDPGIDASIDAGPGMDAGRDGQMPDPDAGPACDVATHTGCGENQLCCPASGGPSCIDTTPGQCTACNTEAAPTLGACNVSVAASCAGRVCECVAGSGAACGGDAPRCVEGACVDCAVDEDCTEPGRGQCVSGVCSGCDSADGGIGCSNPTPICVNNSCVGCDGTNACDPPLSCDNGSCFGCVVLTNAGCGGSTPICQQTSPGVFECVGCTADGQCGGQQCVPQSAGGACQACDPRDGFHNDGCNNAASPICFGTPAACVPCDDVGTPAQNDAACDDESPGTVCVTAGARRGECRACDPTNDNGCTGANDQCASNNTCVDCIGSDGCGSNQVCVDGGNVCVECNDNADCADESAQRQCKTSTHSCEECLTSAHCAADEPICNTNNNTCGSCVSNGGDAACAARTPGTVCITSGARAGQCGTCDPADDGGCTAPNDQCNPATLTCVDCIGAAGCGANQVCLTGANSCVECNSTADCEGGEVCDTASHTCVECLANTQCSGAEPLCDTAANVCEACTEAGNNAADNAACNAITAMSVCVSSGTSAGRCGACDPADDDGCTGTADQCTALLTCVECESNADCTDEATDKQCNTTSHTCVECLNASQCTGNQVCDANACEPCTVDTDCAGHPTGAQCALVGAVRQCRVCDPVTAGDTTDDQGCAMGQICNETMFVCE